MASAWGASWGSAWGNSWGQVGEVVQPEVTKGGAAEGLSRTLKIKREKDRRKQFEQYIESRPPFEIEEIYEDILPEDISEVTRDIVTGGKVFVSGSELDVQGIPQAPELLLQPVKEIKDELTQELARELRKAEVQRYFEAVEAYQAEVRRFEEELMVFLLLAVD